jgi:hypothetical protein
LYRRNISVCARVADHISVFTSFNLHYWLMERFLLHQLQCCFVLVRFNMETFFSWPGVMKMKTIFAVLCVRIFSVTLSSLCTTSCRWFDLVTTRVCKCMQREPLQCFTGLFILYYATLRPVRPTSRTTNIVKVFHVLNLAVKQRARDCVLPCLPIVSWKQFSPAVPSFYCFLSEQNIAAGYAVIKPALLKPRTNKARATRYLNSNEARRKGNRKIGKAFGSKLEWKRQGW